MAETLNSPPSRQATRQPRHMTLEAYFRAEEKAADKHEFHNGIILGSCQHSGKMFHQIG